MRCIWCARNGAPAGRVVRALVAFCLAAGLLSAGCGKQAPPESGSLAVAVSILPQAYVVNRIAGPHASVEVLVGPGQSHETYEPTPRQMSRMESVRLYFALGLPFEKALLPKLQSLQKQLTVIDTRQGITLLPMDTPRGHAGEGGSTAAESDPHIWLDPSIVRVQAATICSALVAVDPLHATDYRHGCDELVHDLTALDDELREAFSHLKSRTFYVFHPAFGYFAHAYGLHQVAAEVAGKEPSAQQLADFISRARADSVKYLYVQPQFAQDAIRAVAEAVGAAIVPLDPLAYDYLDNMREIASKLGANVPRQEQ